MSTLAFVCGVALGVSLGFLISRADDIWWARKLAPKDDGTADRGD